MAVIQRRKHARSSVLLLASTMPLATFAAESHIENNHHAVQLAPIKTKANQAQGYLAKKLASSKYSQDLVDTPQTVTVIKKELLQEQGATTLLEALRNTPGVTLQLGENGNTSTGDTFQLRGFSAQSSIFVDGVRDLGAVTRDVFNLEQVEVVKGSGAAETGRAITSGYINTITKLPEAEAAQSIGLSYNTAEQVRATVDVNQPVGENSAIRLNAFGQQGGVDGRNEVEQNSYGIAPSFAFGLGTATRLYAYSQHVRQRNIPDGGIPTIGMSGYFRTAATSGAPTAQQAAALNAAPKVDRENFYGSVNDYEDTNADMYTLKVEHDVSDNLKVQNTTRYGHSNLQRELTSPGNANVVDINNLNTWTSSLSRQGVDQDNTILANQTNVTTRYHVAGFENDLVAGIELLREEQQTNSLAVVGTQAAANLYQPNPHSAFNAITENGAYSIGRTDTFAAYLLNTFKVNEQLQLSAGIRSDRYITTSEGFEIPRGGTAATGTAYDLKDADLLISWRAGALFKPTPSSSVYANYSKSLTPPGANNFLLAASASSINNAAFDPQETQTYELGTKWDVLNEQLSLNAAVYRTTNDKQVTQDAITREYFQEGKTQVQGVELSAVGKLSDNWQMSAGVAYMDLDAKNQQSVNATNGAVTTTTGVRWSPNVSATLWSDYTWNQFKFGLGARYMGEQDRVVSTSSAGNSSDNMPKIADYYVFDAALSYDLTPAATVSVNIYNLFDKEYINTLNNGGSRMVLGQPLSGKLSVNYKF